MSPPAPVILVRGLTKRYGDLTAVRALSFEVEPGDVLGLVGPNGAGKTTTLRSLAGIIHASEGHIEIAGHDLACDPIEAKRHLAFVPDDPRFFDYLTVEEHLRFVARLYNVAGATERSEHLLERLELEDKRGQLPEQLSRGMKQKLAIACGLLHRPTAIVFDEPLSGLDPGAMRRMKDTILDEARGGAAVILSSHQLQLVEELCTRVLIMRRGERAAFGTIEEIFERHPELRGCSLEEVFLILTGEPEEPLEPSGTAGEAVEPGPV